MSNLPVPSTVFFSDGELTHRWHANTHNVLCTHTQCGFPTGERNRRAFLFTAHSRFHICAYISYFSPPDIFFEEEEIKGIWRNWKGKREFAIRGGKEGIPPPFPSFNSDLAPPYISLSSSTLFFARNFLQRTKGERRNFARHQIRQMCVCVCVCEWVYFFSFLMPTKIPCFFYSCLQISKGLSQMSQYFFEKWGKFALPKNEWLN